MREENTVKVDKIKQLDIDSIIVDHYMYLMPDDFILDAVVNPFRWTLEEYLLAKKILKQRNISPWQKK